LLDFVAPASFTIRQILNHGFILGEKRRQGTGPFGPFTFRRRRINHGPMNSNYHLTDATRQSYTSGAGSGTNFSARLVAANSTKSLRLPRTTIGAHPVLVGDREMLEISV
jgi:hypothetical protein